MEYFPFAPIEATGRFAQIHTIRMGNWQSDMERT